MAGEALAVLEELTTELTPDVADWLCPRCCIGQGGEGGRRKEALAMGRKKPPSSRPKTVPDFWKPLSICALPPDSSELFLHLSL